MNSIDEATVKSSVNEEMSTEAVHDQTLERLAGASPVIRQELVVFPSTWRSPGPIRSA